MSDQRCTVESSSTSELSLPHAGKIFSLLDAYGDAGLLPSDIARSSLLLARKPEAANVFLHLDEDAVLADATGSDRRWGEGKPAGQLDGIPIAWKDAFDRDGERTTLGSALRLDAPPANRTARCIEALGKEGAVFFGRTNMSEFAFSGLGINPHFGTPINPWSREVPLVPGGSSSGSAVAVALGIVPVSVGTDTSGSIRVPAAFNGLVGFKPSQARYSRDGMHALAASLDCVGIVATTVEDCFAIDRVLSKTAQHGASEPARIAARFVVPTGILNEATPIVRHRFEMAASWLGECGVAIEYRDLPCLDNLLGTVDRLGAPVAAEAAQTFADLLCSGQIEHVDGNVRRRLLAGAQIPFEDIRTLTAARGAAIRALNEDIGSAFVLFPTVPVTAPPIAELREKPDLFAETNSRVLRHTMLANLLDMPAISLPLPPSGRGLPVGLQISAPTGRDDDLLYMARKVQTIFQAFSENQQGCHRNDQDDPRFLRR